MSVRMGGTSVRIWVAAAATVGCAHGLVHAAHSGQFQMCFSLEIDFQVLYKMFV